MVDRSNGVHKYLAHTPEERRALMSLVPYFRDRVIGVLLDMRERGFDPLVAEGRRSLARQVDLKRKGRTRALLSRHLVGKAVDIVDRKKGWQAERRFWSALGSAYREHGIYWGGLWRAFPDPCHGEWRGGRIR